MTNWSQLGVAAIANGEHLKSGKALHIHDDDVDDDDDGGGGDDDYGYGDRDDAGHISTV